MTSDCSCGCSFVDERSLAAHIHRRDRLLSQVGQHRRTEPLRRVGRDRQARSVR